MARLSRADMGAVLAFTSELSAAASAPDRADEWIVERISSLVAAEVTSYAQIDSGHHIVHAAHFPGPQAPPTDEEWPLIIDENPFCHYAARKADPFFSARRLTDVVEIRAFKRTAFSRIIGWGLRHDVQTRLPGRPGTHWVLELARSGRNFSRRDLAVIDGLRPALMAHEAHRSLVEEVRQLRHASPAAVATDCDLSTRENEVLDLVALGAANAEIAEVLRISPGTVRKHLEHIYVKLEVGSRTAALARTGRSGSHSSA